MKLTRLFLLLLHVGIDLAIAGYPPRTGVDLPQCPIADPIEIGHIEESELIEASGLVASHRYPGTYYSIQDSQNPNKVYAMKYNGEAIGKLFKSCQKGKKTSQSSNDRPF